MPRRPHLVIVSNRLPVNRVGSGRAARWEESPGGLVTAMSPIFQRTEGAWVGWTGTPGGSQRIVRHNGLRLSPVPLSAAELNAFYFGMSNRTLWPLYHDAIRTPAFDRSWWHGYEEVNERFARAAAKVARAGDVVWVHDYHLHLVPSMLRRLRDDVRIGFFLHIPFPPEELFAWLPWRTALLEGLLGADLVGFQTHASAQNFSRAARRWCDADGTDTRLEFRGRTIAVGSFPVSIDTSWFDAMAQEPRTVAKAAEIRRRVGAGRRIILGVDRLDYTKGIDLRLRAFEELLRRGTASVDKCLLMQIAVPSRENVHDYAAERDRVERTVGRINGEFSVPGRVAVHYFRRNLSREELVAYYGAADVMLVTPLRDGMNLVAKEYVASRADGGGVLVLSEFAGAASELRRALIVNPRDIDGVTATIARALKLPRAEARQRMAILRMQVRRHDAHVWAESFLEALSA